MIISTGGEERVCLLDLEETVVPGTMRATGDWVNVQGGQLQYLGRRDRLIKRHGKRVNLDSVQQVRSSSSALSCMLHTEGTLLSFILKCFFFFFGAGSDAHTLQFLQITVGGAVGLFCRIILQVFERNGCRNWAQCVTL